MRSDTYKSMAIVAIMLLSVLEGAVGLAAVAAGERNDDGPGLGAVPPWYDPLDDLSHVYVPPGGLVGVEVTGGVAQLKSGEGKGWIASSAISCPAGHRYDLVVIEADAPGASQVNITILDATAASTDPAFANKTVPGFVNLTGPDVSVFSVDAAKYPSIRIQVNLAANGTDRPRLLSWKLMFIELGIWMDDFLGAGKLSSWRGLNITDGEVRVGKGGATYDPYPTVALPHGDGDVDVFFASSSGTGYDDRSTISGTKGTNGMDVDDLDGDGYLDLILASDASSTAAASAILWGSASGKWSTSDKQALTTRDTGSDAAVGDFDGDGDKDVIITTLGGMIQGSSYIFLNNGGSFNAAPDITMQQIQGNSVDAGDIDEDGYDDVIIVNTIQTVAKCYYGGAGGPDQNEDIIFCTEITSHKAVTEVLIEDIDGDGHLDVLFATQLDNSKAPVYLGSDSGMDNRADIELTLAKPPMGVDVGDINGDGWMDLAYATVDFTGGGDEVVVFPGSSSGWDDSKAHKITASSGAGPVAVVDIDLDGYEDLIVGTSAKLEVFMGGASLPTTASISKTGLGDPADIVVAISQGGPPRPQGFLVSEPIALPAGMRWDVLYLEAAVPPGTTAAVSVLDTSMVAIDPYKNMGAGDVDLSGLSPTAHATIHLRVDLAGTKDGATPVLERLLVNWHDRFAWREQFYGRAKFGSALGVDVSSFQLSRDLAMTEAPDLLFASVRGDVGYLTPSLAFVDYADVDQDYGARPPVRIATQGASAVATYDVNGDGLLDLFFSSYGTSDASFVSKSPVFLGHAAGWYQHPYHSFPTTGARDIAVADLNKDGYADVVFAQERDWLDDLDNSTLFWGSASGWNSTPDLEFSTSAASGVEATDVDGDGRLDLVFANFRAGSFATDSVVFLQQGGTFCSTVPSHKLATVGARAVASGDLNGDGRADLVFANSFNGLTYEVDSYVYWGTASGGFLTTPTVLHTTGATDVKVADLDGDTDLDVVFANSRNESGSHSARSGVFINPGSGAFSAAPTHALPTVGANAVVAEDLDGAGDLDIVFATLSNGTTYKYDSIGYISSSGGWPPAPNLRLPTVGAMDVVAVPLGGPDKGGYISQAITPDAKEDIGSFHTLSYVASKGAQVHGTVAIVDATTGEELAKAQLADGPNSWDLRGAVSLRAHPSVRVLASVGGLNLDSFTLDDLWLNWTKRVPQAPVVVDAAFTAPYVYRANTVELWVNVTDEYDTPVELTLGVQHQLEGETVWRASMLGLPAFIGGAWRVPVVPDRATAVGNYSFRVNATDSDGLRSEFFAVPTVLEVLPNLPTEPLQLKAVAGNKNVTLTWRKPIDEGDLPVASYEIWRGLLGGMSPLVTVDGETIRYVDTAVENGQLYYYSVRALNSLGEGPFSAMVNATPMGMPGVPDGLEVVAGDGAADLQWSAPLDDGGLPVLGYKVYRGEDPDDVSLVANVVETTYADTDLENGVVYHYRVSAYNGNGEGWWTPAVSARPLGLPDAPDGLAAVVGIKSLTLSWDAPTRTGGAVISGFVLYMGVDGGALTKRIELSASQTTFTDDELEAGTSYSYAVSATTVAGEGPMSAVVTAVPIDLPGAPLNLKTTTGDKRVTLNWDAPTYIGGSEVTGYVVLRGASASTLEELARIGNMTTYIDMEVTNGVTYHYAVRAVNAAGDGILSAVIQATPEKLPTRPGKVLTLGGEAKDKKVTLVWSAPADDGGSPVTGYVVLRGLAPDAMTVIANVGPVLTYADANVSQGKTYYYSVAAVNLVGQGEVFAAYEVKVPKKKDDSPGAGALAALAAVALVALMEADRRRRK